MGSKFVRSNKACQKLYVDLTGFDHLGEKQTLLVVGEVWYGVHCDEPPKHRLVVVGEGIKSVGVSSQIHLHRRVHAGWSEVVRPESFSGILSKMMPLQGRA
jgi:hypothetical protein